MLGVLVAVFRSGKPCSHWVATRNICSCLRRRQNHINSFMCIPSLNTTWIAATTFASLKYSAFMKLIMVHWCGGFGDEQCWVVLWTPNEDFGCITSHAQSTAATYFTGAVKSDDVHLIMVCWAFLLQSFGAENLVHTGWPPEIFAHACVDVKTISIPLCASPPLTQHG